MVKGQDGQLLNLLHLLLGFYSVKNTKTRVEIIVIVWETNKEKFIDTIRLDRLYIGLVSASQRVLGYVYTGLCKFICPRKSACSKLELWYNGNPAMTDYLIFFKEEVISFASNAKEFSLGKETLSTY